MRLGECVLTRTVALVTMKGGSGKSTTAMCLAGHWMAAGLRTGVIDADTSRSAARWVESGDALTDLVVRPVNGKTVAPVLDEMRAQGLERIVIDTPGFRMPGADAAVRRADLVIVPVRPSPVDFQIAADTAELLDEIFAGSRRAPVRFLLTQANPASVIARHMRGELTAAGYELFDAELPFRVAYSEAPLVGSTPTLYQPSGIAAQDIAALAGEIDQLLGAGPTAAQVKGSP